MRDNQVSLDDLRVIPFLDVENIGSRTLVNAMFYDGGEWHSWIAIPGRGMQKMKMSPAESLYWAKEPEEASDIMLPFMDFIAQHCMYSQAVRTFFALHEDFFNICASLAKIDLLVEHGRGKDVGVSRLVVTELEYLFSLCRSMFDLLQEMIAAQWQTVKLFDTTLKKKQLRETFSGMVLTGDRLRTRDELAEQFAIPPKLVQFYIEFGAFFSLLREFRDKYVHGGNTPEHIFVTEKGFAVERSREPFASFFVWNDEHMLPNELCSLKPALGHLVLETLRACDAYAQAMAATIQYPKAMVPGMHLFFRGYYNETFQQYVEARDKCLWWPEAPPAGTT